MEVMEGIDVRLLKKLRNSYQAIEKLQVEWQKAQNSSFVVVESLLNLSEQLQCCDEGAFERELRDEFPDLKKRLAYKITKAMEGKMRKLYQFLYTFKDIKEELKSVRNSTFIVYHECIEKLDIETLTRGSPTCPPVSTQLEWMTDLSRWYNNLYEQKKDLLDNIRYSDKTYFLSFVKKWKDETCLYRVKGWQKFEELRRVFIEKNAIEKAK